MKNNLIFLFFLFTFSCKHSKDQAINLPIPDPPNFNLDIPPPPSFTPNLYKVQINSVPMPFHIAHCYIVWVNGKRVMLNATETIQLAESLSLPIDPPKDTKELHNGEGWHKPLRIVNY